MSLKQLLKKSSESANIMYLPLALGIAILRAFPAPFPSLLKITVVFSL